MSDIDIVERLRFNADLMIQMSGVVGVLSPEMKEGFENLKSNLRGAAFEIETLRSEKEAAANRYDKSLTEMLDYQMDIAAELAELKAAHEWKPMETAPKEYGECFLVNHKEFGPLQAKYDETKIWNGEGLKVLRTETRLHIRNMNGWNSTQSEKFTGWRALPESPKETKS